MEVVKIMSNISDLMRTSLKEIVVPYLREKGFKGSGNHFRRSLPNRTDLLIFQFSMWGGGLYVEISKCSPEGYVDREGKHYPANKVRVYDIYGGSFLNRHRLDKHSPQQLFEFDEHNTDEVAQLILSSIQEEAEEWWENHLNWWEVNPDWWEFDENYWNELIKSKVL